MSEEKYIREFQEELTRNDMRDLYLASLGGVVNYGNKTRPRVRHIQSWENLPLNAPIDFGDRDVWVWSDLHFGHKNIIDYSNRPHPDIETMDKHLIENFNDWVKPDDISIWVGDVAFYNDEQATNIVNSCNGYKILIVGNHDFSKKKVKQMGFDEVHLLVVYETTDVQLLFTHYPIDMEFPWINVHGHEHNNCFSKYTRSLQHINVNCEFHGYKPITLQQVCDWAKTRMISYEPFEE